MGFDGWDVIGISWNSFFLLAHFIYWRPMDFKLACWVFHWVEDSGNIAFPVNEERVI